VGKLHYLTALLLIILLAIASGWVFESIEKNPILTKKKKRHDPDYFLKNFTATTMDKSGKPSYRVKAAHLNHYPDDDSIKILQPFFTFYAENRKAWTIQANEAVVLQKKDEIYLTGNVVLNQLSSVKKKQAIRLTAERLTIEPKRNLVHTRSKVKLYQGQSTIQAIGMRADMRKKRIEFLSKTRSHYVIPAK